MNGALALALAEVIFSANELMSVREVLCTSDSRSVSEVFCNRFVPPDPKTTKISANYEPD